MSSTRRSTRSSAAAAAAAQAPAQGSAPVASKSRAGTAKKKGTKPAADETSSAAGAPADNAVQQQIEALQLLVRQQAEAQARLQAELLAARSAPSPKQPASSSQQQQQRGLNASAAAASASTAARKEPRLSDLADYDGTAGEKLDTWLDSLQRCADYYEMGHANAVRFAVAHLRETAYDWWRTLGSDAQAAVHAGGVVAFATALRARFQPVTTERVAREKLDKLAQGNRHVNEYIADFNKLRARIPSMSEADALYAFERGLRFEVAMELRKQRIDTLRAATDLAAHIGGVAGGQQGKSSLNQLDLHDGNGAPLDVDRITKAVLNAMHAREDSGSKTQMHQGYTQERQRGGRRGGVRGGRGGRSFGQRGPPEVPGVSEHVVRQRLDAQQCVRCGKDGHRSPGCPNAISALGN
jgi:hypothetical protein